MKAVITIPLSKDEALKAIKAISQESRETERINSTLKATSEGLEIVINADDSSMLRAGINGVLKLYKVHEEIIKCLKCQTKQKIK